MSEARAAMMLSEVYDSVVAANGAQVNTVMREAFDRIATVLRAEDRGWVKVFGAGGGEDDFGLTLDDLKEWSKRIREEVVGAPWIGRGFRLRHSYIWQGGIHYAGLPEATKGKTNVQKKIDDPRNQRSFFGANARREREGRLYHDGIAGWIGEEKTKILSSIPLNQIDEYLPDPDFPGVIWAYKRSWTPQPIDGKVAQPKVLWYFVNEFADKRVDYIDRQGGQREPVSKTHVFFDMNANSMDGYPLGSPDALAASIWNRYARDATMDGIDMSEAMATFAFKASVASKTAGDNSALQFASTRGAGSTAVLGLANNLVPLASAGRAYEFDKLMFLTAIIAASIDVSNIHITAHPGAAGSSYGSAQTLDLPTRLAMEYRRQEHIDMDTRILRWMGADNPVVHFEPLLAGEEIYRKEQSVTMKWNTGLYDPKEIKAEFEALAGRLGVELVIPDGVMLPNNEKYTGTLTNDNQPQQSPTGPQAASPNQGRGNGTGGADNTGNDIRRDQ